jgi:DNA-binding CsgD family transcriptional regulator
MTDTPQFSKREQEVIDLLLQGKSNQQIAVTLGISESTVEFHLKNIYTKLQVSSRPEAILKLLELRKSTGIELGKSVVDGGGEKTDNGFVGKYKLLIWIGILLAVIIVIVLSRPKPWERYERECEYPDENTVGQMLWRMNASGSKVHGQFGTTGSAPWPAQPGYVRYMNIHTPRIDELYLELLYSKNTPSSVPILIYLDDEPTPRASIYPIDKQNWDQFTWTEPIFLGKIENGVHSIKFSAEGQQYGVADLDRLILTRKSSE